MNLLRLIQRAGAAMFAATMLSVLLLVIYHGLDLGLHESAGHCVPLGHDLRVCLLAD